MLNSAPVLPTDFSTRADRDRTFVFEPAVQRVFEINSSGGAVLSLINGRRKVSEIASILRRRFTNPPQAQDLAIAVAAFLNSLRIAGMRIGIRGHRFPASEIGEE